MRGTDAMSSNIRTKTTLFLVPLLGFYKEDLLTEDFINAYLKVGNEPEEEGFIYLVYKLHKPGLDNRHDVYHSMYEGHHVYKVHISKPILKKFSEGKYSMFTPTEKDKILAFWGVSKGSRLHGILNPKTVLYEHYSLTFNLSPSAQIWPKPLITDETFN